MAQAFVKANTSSQNKCPSLEFVEDNEDESVSDNVSDYIIATIKKHRDCGVINIKPENVVSADTIPNSSQYLLPSLLIWNPTVLFPNSIRAFKCPKCKLCVEQLPFEDYHLVRTLYGKQEQILLVSTKYVCPLHHAFSGYDPRLLQSLPSQELVPFILFHKVGVTRELFDHVISSVSTGSKFNEMERRITEEYWQTYARREHSFWSSVNLYREKNPDCDITHFSFKQFDTNKHQHPSNDILTSCFLLFFMENEQHFTNCMANTTAREWISLDHTFKVASNIGLNNPDGKWAKQFSSLMCVLNESGNVLSWKLTKSESFDHIEDMLQALKSRHAAHGIVLKGACIDNCCHWRAKLQSVFGEHFTVVLDLFHAVSRITRKMPKRHNLRSQCVKDLRIVFRSPSDLGDERREHTPCSKVMKEQMETFIEQWSVAQDEKGEAILPNKAVKECQKLLKHIEKGCLSGIEPHMSTSRNERLHRELKAQITNCKLGIPVALAALTIVFYRHNTRTPNGIVPPLLTLTNEALSSGIPSSMVKCNESFGLGPSLTNMDDSNVTQNSTSWNESSLDANAIADLLETIPLDHDLKIMLSQAFAMKFYEDEMLDMLRDSLLFEPKFIPFSSTAVSVICNEDLSSAYNMVPVKNYRNLLKMCSFLYLNGPESSTSMAASFSVAFAQQVHHYIVNVQDNDKFAHHLIEILGLDTNVNEADVHNKVSCLAKSEEESPEQVIQRLSTVVGVIINIFTNCSSIAVIPVFPTQRFPCSPVFHFHCVEQGLFYAVSLKQNNNDTSLHEVNSYDGDTSCHCGRSHKTDVPKCITKPGQKYRSRCSCLAKGLPCTSRCECQGCGNPFGIRPPPIVRKIVKRERVEHRAQALLDSAKNGLDIMLQSNETPMLGYWTRVEHHVFEALAAKLKREEEHSIDIDYIKSEFNSACNVLLSQVNHHLPIGCKSTMQVKAKVAVHERTLFSFKELFKQSISELFKKM